MKIVLKNTSLLFEKCEGAILKSSLPKLYFIGNGTPTFVESVTNFVDVFKVVKVSKVRVLSSKNRVDITQCAVCVFSAFDGTTLSGLVSSYPSTGGAFDETFDVADGQYIAIAWDSYANGEIQDSKYDSVTGVI